MPSTLISVRRRWSVEKRRELIDGVQSALMETYGVPPNDRTLRIIELHPEDFVVARGNTENYTLIEIDVYPGRSAHAKKLLYQKIVHNLGGLGIAPHDIKIVLREIKRENWGIRGGVPASEVEPGFKRDA